ncbi:nitroreductase family protein [Paenibacillus cremeus]|uniref:Nitroreductase family protein n=1 Tax=Paenibacillus cremeus TaxID=2163881 RepID=A0A559KGX3_9BACL|nr:nitroreductase family protein [Paenibacillus cremeus]TVY11387.1 nitroreductase family protein [Paenibacillus cremeus]
MTYHSSVTSEATEHRHADHEIDPQFLNRWSPRSFKEKPVPDEALYRLFEAARWAPSGNNEQPWRYIIARTMEDRATFLSFIAPSNAAWCSKAPVLVLVASAMINSRGAESRSHAFDAGAAWGYLALEAGRQGLIAHAMGGFERDKARETLGVPADYALHAVVAIGYRGEREALPEALQAREQPSSRKPLAELLHEGRFGASISNP